MGICPVTLNKHPGTLLDVVRYVEKHGQIIAKCAEIGRMDSRKG
jgi:hypothetical protein